MRGKNAMVSTDVFHVIENDAYTWKNRCYAKVPSQSKDIFRKLHIKRRVKIYFYIHTIAIFAKKKNNSLEKLVRNGGSLLTCETTSS